MITLPVYVLILIIAGSGFAAWLASEAGRAHAVQRGVDRRLEWELDPRRLNDEASADAAEREGTAG